MQFAKKLAGLMRELGINQTKLSELTGISKSCISQYLSGEHEPYEERKKDIARALGVQETYFRAFLPVAEIETDPCVNVPVSLAAKLMHKSYDFVTKGLQDGVFPFGYAVKLQDWSYYISAVKFTEHTGIQIPYNEGGKQREKEKR